MPEKKFYRVTRTTTFEWEVSAWDEEDAKLKVDDIIWDDENGAYDLSTYDEEKVVEIDSLSDEDLS